MTASRAVATCAIGRTTPLRRAAIARQARRDATKLRLTMGNDRPPGGAGAARTRREHNAWPAPTRLVVDRPARILNRHVPSHHSRRAAKGIGRWAHGLLLVHVAVTPTLSPLQGPEGAAARVAVGGD